MGGSHGFPVPLPRALVTSEALSLDSDLVTILVKLGKRHGLTPTCQERLLEVACGASNAEIAATHRISPNTVKTEVAAVLSALSCRCRHQVEMAASVARSELGAGRERNAIIGQLERYLGLR